MRNQPNFTDKFRSAINNHGAAGGEIDTIDNRKCDSDRYSGREYTFYGQYIPLRPIIDTVAAEENFAIDEMSFVDESTPENDVEARLIVFVADLRDEQTHPAFTNN